MKNTLQNLETPFLAQEYVAVRPRLRADRKCWFWLVLAWIVLQSVVGIIALALALFSELLAWWVFPILCLVMMALNQWGSCFRPRSLKINEEMYRRLNQVPPSLASLAQQFYGKDTVYPWMFSAIECHEAHLPGDCPLCGAK